jgi:cold shock CspA family protein
MQGTMLWFNVDKGYGFIRTEQGERLKVAHSAFLAGHRPEARCKGREVSFERRAGTQDDDAHAVGVSFIVAAEPRRARRRHAHGGHSI